MTFSTCSLSSTSEHASLRYNVKTDLPPNRSCAHAATPSADIHRICFSSPLASTAASLSLLRSLSSVKGFKFFRISLVFDFTRIVWVSNCDFTFSFSILDCTRLISDSLRSISSSLGDSFSSACLYLINSSQEVSLISPPSDG